MCTFAHICWLLYQNNVLKCFINRKTEVKELLNRCLWFSDMRTADDSATCALHTNAMSFSSEHVLQCVNCKFHVGWGSVAFAFVIRLLVNHTSSYRFNKRYIYVASDWTRGCVHRSVSCFLSSLWRGANSHITFILFFFFAGWYLRGCVYGS
jgi:hypothetical protein